MVWRGRITTLRRERLPGRSVPPALMANDRKEVMMGCHRKRMFLLFMLLACVNLLAARPASAQDLVSGRYISSAGRSIVLDLDIKGPSTGNLIVHQFLAAEVDILASSPSLVKFDRKSGKVQ